MKAPLVLVLILLALGATACGKRGAPAPPEDRRAEYNWPLAYPSPRSVQPRATAAEEEETAAPAQALPPRTEELNLLPKSRTRTTTIGPVSSE